MEKTSKSFGQRFLAVLCALTMLFTLCPQGAFAAAPEPEAAASAGERMTSGDEGALGGEDLSAPTESNPTPTEGDPTPTEGDPTPTEGDPTPTESDPTPTEDPDGGNGIMLTALDTEGLTITGDKEIEVTPDEELTSKTIELTAAVTGTPDGPYTWSITDGEGSVVTWDGAAPGNTETVKLKALTPGEATVTVECDGQTATWTGTIIQQYRINGISLTGRADANYREDKKITVTVQTKPAGVGVTASVNPKDAEVVNETEGVPLPVTYDETGVSEYYKRVDIGKEPNNNTVNVFIHPLPVTLQSVSFTGKSYDGNGIVTASGYTFKESVANEEGLTIEGVTYTANKPDAGDNIPVMASGADAKLSGSKSGNYKLDDIAGAINKLDPENRSVNISKKNLTLTVSGTVLHTSDGSDQPTEDEITNAAKPDAADPITCVVDETGIVDQGFTAEVDPKAAEAAWRFTTRYPGADIDGDTVTRADFTITATGTADEANYTIIVDPKDLHGTISAQKTKPEKLDTTAGNVDLTLTHDVPVAFKQGVQGADEAYWYSDGAHPFGMASADVALYTVDGEALGDPFDAASVLEAGSNRTIELFIKTTAELGDASTGTIPAETVFGPVTVTYNYDTAKPKIELQSVTGTGDHVGDKDSGVNFGTSLTYTVDITDPDGSGIRTSEYFVARGNTLTPDEESSGDWIPVTAGEAVITMPSWGYLFVRAADYTGNTYTTETGMHALVVETTAPTVTFGSFSADPVQGLSIDWTVTETGDCSGIYKAEAELVNVSGQAGTAANLSDDTVKTTGTPPASLGEIAGYMSLSGKTTVKDLSGTYRLKVTATDFCGNTQEYQSKTFTLDNTDPTVSVAMAGGRQSGDTWYYNADNCGLTVTVKDEFLAPATPAPGGDQTLTVTLTDSVGKKLEAKADLVAGNNAFTDDVKDASVSIAENQAVVTFLNTALHDPGDPDAGLADGEITVTAEVTDRAGNWTTIIQGTGTEEKEKSVGVTVADGSNAAFTLDTVAPVVTGIKFSDEDSLYHDAGRDNYYSGEDSVTLTFAVTEKNGPEAWNNGYSYTTVAAPADVQSKVGTGLTITVKDEADYFDFFLQGKDLAGNPLTLDQAVRDSDKAKEEKTGSGDGKITVKAGMVVDRTAPEATISYTGDGTDPNFYPGEDGRKDVGGALYYRSATVTADIRITDGHQVDRSLIYAASGETAQTVLPATAIGERGDDAAAAKEAGWTAKFGAGSTDHPDDGRYHVTVWGTDRAGNPLKVTEEKTAAGTKDITTEPCSTSFTAKYTLVLDRIAPTAVMTLVPGADTKNTELWNGRYYFNKDFSIELTVKDANPDPQKTDFTYGEDKNTLNFAASDVSPKTPVDKSEFHTDSAGTTVTASCESRGDGAYIYRVTGFDKAGNALVLSGEAAGKEANRVSIDESKDPFTTYVIVVDMTPPVANVTMENFYAAKLEGTSYTPTVNMPYQKKSSTTVTFALTDRSPTQIEYHISSTRGDKTHIPDKNDFTYNASITEPMSGEQIFYLDKPLVVTDLAGNVSRMDDPTNKIYLDVEVPNVDELAPTVQLVTTHNGMGRGPGGVDLYDGTVTVRAIVRDPNAKVSASGLYEVYYKVLVDNADWTDRVESSSALAQSGLIRYGTSGPTYGETFPKPEDVKDETIVTEDDITFTFPAETFNYNDVYIYVWAKDNSGNELTEKNAAFYRFGIDVTEPTIQVTYDNNEAENEKYFKADRTATVVITERNFDPDRTEIRTESQASVGGWSYAAGAAANGDDDTWTCDVVYSVDGDYTFDVTTTDQVGHTAAEADYGASVAPKEFTIDKTDPVITVTFNNNDERNGRYYNAARTATILIDEHNFDAAGATVETTADIQEGRVAAPGASGWSSAGDNNTATVAFLEDGDYTMDVEYTDLAGNEAEPEHIDLFTVDTTAPELEIGGVEDHVAYNGEVAPSITYHDINYDNTSAQVTITGYRHTDGENLQGARTDDAFGGSLVCDNIPAVRENDDVYTATGFVSDLAGNTSEATIVFSVNRFGSTYMLSEQTRALVDGYYTNQPQDLHITEINVSKLVEQNVSVSLNGDLTNLNANTDYTVQESNPGWMQYDYAVHAANFDQEGAYTVTLYSEDDAANTNTNQAIRENDGATNTLPIEFLVDMTAPVTLITGVEDNERYVDTERTLMVIYEDNTALAGLSMYIGSDRVADYSAEQLRDAGGQLEYVAKAANDWQTLRVTAVDVAGNSSEIASGRFLLTDNLWVQYINNTPLVIGSVGGICLLFLLIFLLLRRRKKEEE